MYNYGECEICNALLQERNIHQDLWIRNKLVIIDNVPAGVCSQCGEKVVNAEVGEHIMKLVRSSKYIEKAPTIPVPFINYRVESEMEFRVRH